MSNNVFSWYFPDIEYLTLFSQPKDNVKHMHTVCELFRETLEKETRFPSRLLQTPHPTFRARKMKSVNWTFSHFLKPLPLLRQVSFIWLLCCWSNCGPETIFSSCSAGSAAQITWTAAWMMVGLLIFISLFYSKREELGSYNLWSVTDRFVVVWICVLLLANTHTHIMWNSLMLIWLIPGVILWWHSNLLPLSLDCLLHFSSIFPYYEYIFERASTLKLIFFSLSVVWRVKFRCWSLSREESWRTWRRRRTDCRYINIFYSEATSSAGVWTGVCGFINYVIIIYFNYTP